MENPVLELKREMHKDYYYSEAIKTLRTNLQFCGRSIKVIMLTSATPDEGKSDISFALAQSLAQIGKKTLLVDGDIRKSVLPARYQITQEINGLSQYLSGQRDLEEIIYETSEKMYRELEQRVQEELAYDVNRYQIRTGIIERSCFDASHQFFSPMEDRDLKALSYEAGDIWEGIEKEGQFILMKIMLRCDYLQLKEF